MAQILKRCDDPPDRWSRCEHSWTVRYWADGRQREKSFHRNYRLAQQFARNIEADKLSVHRGDAPSGSIRFGEYAETWLATHSASVASRQAYDSSLRNHILPIFGGRQLSQVANDREGVTEFLRATLPAKGLGPSQVGTARVVLTAIMNEAVRAGRIPSHRLGRIRTPPASSRAEFYSPTFAELSALVEAMPAHLRLAVWLMRGCGLRLGEALAVRADAFTDGRLRITEQATPTGALTPLKSRKAGDYRDIPVPAYVTAKLAEHPVKTGYLFPGRRAVTMHRVTFGQAFRDAAKVAGLPPSFTPHSLRHVFASVALARGVPVTDVSRWLGHRNIQVTFSIYSHFIPEAWQAARAALDAEYRDWSAAS